MRLGVSELTIFTKACLICFLERIVYLPPSTLVNSPPILQNSIFNCFHSRATLEFHIFSTRPIESWRGNAFRRVLCLQST